MSLGNIIWLNGVSSSGKTTLAKMLQQKFDVLYYWVAHDIFHEMNSKKLLQTDFLEFESENAIMVAHTAKMLSDLGRNVIVDSVFLDESTVQKSGVLKTTVKLLHIYPVLFVHVKCSEEELIRRERARQDRHIGQAVAQLRNLIPKEGYDFTVDTSLYSVEECAEQIMEQMNTNQKLAFKSLYEMFEGGL